MPMPEAATMTMGKKAAAVAALFCAAVLALVCLGRPYRVRARMFRAIEEADPAALSRALDSGADPNAVRRTRIRRDGWRSETPLRMAVVGRNAETVELLLDAGADLPADPVGWTLLHWAAWSGDEDVVRLLLERGADPTASKGTSQTPAQVADDHGHRSVAELLRDAAKAVDVRRRLSSTE